jgi:hypothetical protein
MLHPMRRRAFFLASAALALALPGARIARATTIEALDLRELVRGSDHVLVGFVLRTDVHLDHRERIVTDATIRIDERLHGPAAAGSTVVVRSLGGELGDLGLRIEGEPSFVPGERLVLFGRTIAADRVLRPVGMSQGVLPIERRPEGDVVLPGGQGLAMVQRGSDGQLRGAPPALLEPRPIDELLAEVRDLVAEIHGAR